MKQTGITTASALISLLCRDIGIAYRKLSELLNPILFFLITVSLFPLGVSPDPALLQKIAPGVIWIAALLATLLALDGLFRNDFEDGSLEQLIISPQPLAILAGAKVLAHWLITGLPLILVSIVLAVMLNLSPLAYGAMLVSLILGTPAMSLIGAIGAALTVSTRKSGVLLTLIVMPLYIPILIFGTSAIQIANQQQSWLAQVYFLGAILVLCLVLAPFAIASALKISLN